MEDEIEEESSNIQFTKSKEIETKVDNKSKRMKNGIEKNESIVNKELQIENTIFSYIIKLIKEENNY